jgi:hypothetical protein
VDEASGHSGKCGELILVKPQLESPTSDLLGPGYRRACTIVHKGKSTLGVAQALVLACTIVHVLAELSTITLTSTPVCTIVHMI